MSDNPNAIVLRNSGDFLTPAASLETMLGTYQIKLDFIHKILVRDVDFGVIPGTGAKPALFKAGAEKIASFFALAPVFEDVTIVEDWTGADHNGEPLFYYRQRCKLYRGDRLIGSAEGSCNSWESKYRYRWVPESELPAGINKSGLKTKDGSISEMTFAVEKAETTGKYGKPAEYWRQFQDAITNGTATKGKKTIKDKTYDVWIIGATVYRVPNPDVSDQINTILKMAQKRALVAAVLITTNTSENFTQDIEDYVEGNVIEVSPTTPAVTNPPVVVTVTPEPVKTQTPTPAPVPHAPAPVTNPAPKVETPQHAPAPVSQPAQAPAKPEPESQATAELTYTGVLAKVGKHQYPAPWARICAAYVRVNPFEIDGILQKLALPQATTPEAVIAELNKYLDAKA